MARPLILLLTATAGFLIYGLVAGSPFVFYYVPITLMLTLVVWAIHRSAHFSNTTLMALALAAIGNLAGGVLLINGAPLYGLAVIGEIRYDKIFHAAATAVAAWASFEAIRRWGVMHVGVAAFVAIMMASGAGAFVEIIEYIGTLIFESTSVGDYGNNMLDLIANTTGAVVAVLIGWRFISRGEPT